MSEPIEDLDEILDDPDDGTDPTTSLATRVRAAAAAMPAPVAAHLPFIDAANKLKSNLVGLVDQLIASRDMGVLLTGSAGVGKTESMLAAASHMLDQAQPVVWASPTIDMALETADRAAGRGISAEVLHGRNELTCNYMDKVRTARAEGYAPGAFVCPSCPKHPDNLPGRMVELWTCGHYSALLRAKRSIRTAKQQKVRLPLIVTTYENAVAGLKYAQQSKQGDIWKTRQVFFDEDPSRAMREKAVLSDDDLTRTPKDEAPANVLRILSRARAIASDERAVMAMAGFALKNGEKSKIHDYDGSSFCSQELHHVLFTAANDLGLDLETCLARASEWAPRVGKGEMFHTDRGMLKYIVNAALPKFAEALHKEITFSYSGTPSTYAVRLDSTKDGHWQYVLDRMIPFRSGRDNVVIGDAYADKNFVRALFGGRPMATVEVRVELPHNVQVFRSTSAKTTRKVLRIREMLHAVLDTEVSTVLRAEAGRKVLVYTHLAHRKDIEDWFASNEDTYNLTEVAFEHYWSGRGKDQYRSFDTILCIGEPVPNLKGLVHEANALHPDEPEVLWNPKSKKIWSEDHRLERVWNMLATQELSQALMRIRPGIPSPSDKRMYIFGNQVPLPSDFIHALHALGQTSPSGDKKLHEGRLELLTPECVRDYIIWVFQVTGCWASPFLVTICEKFNDYDGAAVLLNNTGRRTAAPWGTQVTNLLRPPTRSEVRLGWLRAQWSVRRGVELATELLPPPTRVRPSWLPNLQRPVDVYGDTKLATWALENLYRPEQP
jgi:hypothetical protein